MGVFAFARVMIRYVGGRRCHKGSTVGVAPEADFDDVVAAAGYIGEKACDSADLQCVSGMMSCSVGCHASKACGAEAAMARKPRCLHPDSHDKPLAFACGDCPRK
eukprot:4857731-Amphidinium_carterae.1